MLTMKKADYEKILAHAKENLPEEACGLIAVWMWWISESAVLCLSAEEQSRNMTI